MTRIRFILLLCFVLNAASVAAQPARDFSGIWYDPAHNGEGYVVEVFAEDQAVVYWFTYDGDGEQRWFLGVGSVSGDSLTVSALLVFTGAQFGPEFDPEDVEQQQVGSLTLSFDADSGSAQYTVDGVDGSQDLVRITSPRSIAATPGLADCATGSWFDPSHNGEGYIVHLLDENRAVILWFTYTPDGQQAWFISLTASIEGDSISALMASTSGGRFGPDFDPDDVDFSDWGGLELSLDSCKQGSSDYASVDPEYGEGALENLLKITNLLRPTGLADDPAIQTGLRQILDEQHDQQANIGMSVAVVFADGSAWTGSAGLDDPREAKALLPEQTLGFASITKTFVAAQIMQLVDDGVMSLDDNVEDWLPPQTNITPSARIRHMLNHQSGLADYINDSNFSNFLRSNPDRYWSPETIVERFVNTSYYFPGISSGYSNTNYLVLGQLLEAATGAEVSTLIRQRLLDRNGLDATYVGGEEPSAENIPITWVDIDGNGSLDDYSEFYDSTSLHSARWMAGGMFSTVGDIALWAHVLFKGNVVTPESAQRMRQFLAINGTGSVWTGYGLGVQQFQVSGFELWGHSGGMSGSGSLMVYSPQLDVSIALVDNDRRANHFDTIRQLLPFLQSALESMPK